MDGEGGYWVTDETTGEQGFMALYDEDHFKAIVEGKSAAEESGKVKEKEKVEKGQVSDPVVGEKAIRT